VGFTLQDIKAAMAPIANVGKGELDFEVNGLRLVLRALTPDEEIQVQKYAREVLADGGDVSDQTSMLEYLDRFRWASLGFSLIQIGENDFREVATVETGAKLPNGTPVKVHRHEAFRQLVSTWARPMQTAVFRKFGELNERIEREVEGVIEFDPVDFDAEIARVEDRLRELREEKARYDALDNDPRTRDREQAAGRAKKAKAAKQDSVEEQTSTNQESFTVATPADVEREVVFEEEEPEEPEAPPVAVGPRTPVFARPDMKMPPPAPRMSSQAEPEPQAAVEAEDQPELPAEDHLPDVMSSMVDTSDPDQMEQAVAAETARIAAMRARAAGARKPAPHLAARDVAQEVVGPTTPTLVGKMAGTDVYKMPTQTLTDRRPPDNTPSPAPKSNVNPRFKPAR